MEAETDGVILADQYQHSAATCLQHRDYGSALALYLRLAAVAPERKSAVRDDAALAVREWGATLESVGRVKDALECYCEACRAFPDSETIVNNLGAQLFRLGYVDEAACYFRRAFQLRPSFLEARQNLENVCCHLVERWHFRMLNDEQRNRLFRDAIRDAVKDVVGDSVDVLDIGAGTALLSMFAVQAGADSVVACEVSKTMYELATDVLSANQMAEHVRLVHKSSMDLLVPEDLPKKATLLVTEIFDAGLIGEQTLPTMHHAWQNLLRNDHGKTAVVIPCGATIIVSAIECESIRKQNRFLYPGIPHVDLTSVDLVSHTASGPISSPSADILWEPYTTERLGEMAGGYHTLSHPTAQITFDFNSPHRVSEYVAGFERTLTLSVTEDGRLDAIAMWFELQLDGSRVLKSCPESGSCWEQAIYPVLPSHLTASDSVCDNLYVHSGDILEVACKCTGDALHFHCTRITRQTQRISAMLGRLQSVCIDKDQVEMFSAEERFNEVDAPDGPGDKLPSQDVKTGSGTISDHSGLCDKRISPVVKHNSDKEELDLEQEGTSLQNAPSSPPNGNIAESVKKTSTKRTQFSLAGHEIARLNDLRLFHSYASALRHILTSSGKCRMLALPSDGPSLLAIQALRLGAGAVRTIEPCPAHRRLLHQVAVSNHVRLRCSDSEDFVTLTDHRRKWNVLLCEPVDVCGCLRQRCLEDIALARVTCLRPDGRVIPDTITVIAMAIESQSLRADSMVLGDECTLGLKVAALMNIFKMTTHVDIDLSTLRHIPMTTTFELFSLHLNEPLPSDGGAANFLSSHRRLEVKVTRSGQVTAVVFWFEMRLVPGGVSVNTLDTRTHWKQAAILLAQPLAVEAGDILVLDAVCRGTCIGIEVTANICHD